MDAAVETILAEYEAREAREWDEVRRRPDGHPLDVDDMLISVGRATGTLLNLLAKEAGARRILEIGTSYGYSTVWLAEAARATGGTVISLEIHPKKRDYALAALGRAGLAAHADLRLGDARARIAALPGPFDFVLVDLWKNLYIPCFDLVLPKLAPGALIAADNMTFPEMSRAEAAAYRAHVRTAPHIESVLLPVGSGVELSRYAP